MKDTPLPAGTRRRTGSGAGYQPGDKLATDEFTFAENVNTLTVYAQWSKDEEQNAG